MGPCEGGAFEAKGEGTERDSGSGSLRRHWGRVGLSWEESVGTVMHRRLKTGGQRLELDLEPGRAGMVGVGAFYSAG